MTATTGRVAGGVGGLCNKFLSGVGILILPSFDLTVFI